MFNNMTKDKLPPMEVFEDSALQKAAVDFLWQVRRVAKTDAQEIDNLVDFAGFYFSYLPHNAKKICFEGILKLVGSGEAAGGNGNGTD